MYEQILDEFEQLLQQEIADFGADFAKDEQAVWKTILALGHAALQRMLGAPMIPLTSIILTIQSDPARTALLSGTVPVCRNHKNKPDIDPRFHPIRNSSLQMIVGSLSLKARFALLPPRPTEVSLS